MKKENLLVEIGVEELPINKLYFLSDKFANFMKNNFQLQNISYKKIRCFITPRRISLICYDLSKYVNNTLISGPKLEISYSTKGSKTVAISGFLKKHQVTLRDLKIKVKKNAEWLILEKNDSTGLIQDDILLAVRYALISLSKLDKMHYSEPISYFIRPVRWLNILFNKHILKTKIFNMDVTYNTFGHRFHSSSPIQIKYIHSYESLLRKSFVIACFNKRKKLISDFIYSYCNEKSFEPIINDNILSQLSGIVEYPAILIGSFNEKLMSLPKEILISVIQNQQKCIPLIDKKNRCVINKFIIIANIKIRNNKYIIIGNEKVMHSRLKDAHFHYNEDLYKSLKIRITNLKKIIFFKNLGSMLDKTKRTVSNTKHLDKILDLHKYNQTRLCILAKSDMTTSLVSEFHELKGIVSSYYTQYFGEDKDISISLKYQYFPQSAKEKVPVNQYAKFFCIAELIDSLMCLFKVKNINSDKDPYALRRKALGLMKILIENKISVNLINILNIPNYLYLNFVKEKDVENILSFFKIRLKIWYQQKGIEKKFVHAVIDGVSKHNIGEGINPYEVNQKIIATSIFFKKEDAKIVVDLYKRIKNFLMKNDLLNVNLDNIKFDFFENDNEKILQEKVNCMRTNLQNTTNYKYYYEQILFLSKILDNFLNCNIILSKKKKLLRNRVYLLNTVNRIMNYHINMDFISQV